MDSKWFWQWIFWEWSLLQSVHINCFLWVLSSTTFSMCWSKNIGLSSTEIEPKMENFNFIVNFKSCRHIQDQYTWFKNLLYQWHFNFATLLLMPGMSFGSWHYFVTGVTTINKCVWEMSALNVIEDVVAAFVLEDFPLFST